jgi:hypothetical protein
LGAASFKEYTAKAWEGEERKPNKCYSEFKESGMVWKKLEKKKEKERTSNLGNGGPLKSTFEYQKNEEKFSRLWRLLFVLNSFQTQPFS